MLRHIEVSLRCWHPQGQSIKGKEFIDRLSVESGYRLVVGSGERWQAARVVLVDLSAASFAEQEEPSEAYCRVLQESLQKAGGWLDGIPKSAMEEIRKDGFAIDLFLDALIDQDQLDLLIPAQLYQALAKLGVAIQLITNG